MKNSKNKNKTETLNDQNDKANTPGGIAITTNYFGTHVVLPLCCILIGIAFLLYLI